MQVVGPLTPELEPLVVAFLRERPETVVWQSVHNLRRARELYGCTDRSRVAIDGDEVLGFLPLLEKEGVWNSCNWGAIGGAVGDLEAQEALYEWYELQSGVAPR